MMKACTTVRPIEVSNRSLPSCAPNSNLLTQLMNWSGPRQKHKDKSKRQLQAGFAACVRKPAHKNKPSNQQSLIKQKMIFKMNKVAEIPCKKTATEQS